jgi:hypothetical protein
MTRYHIISAPLCSPLRFIMNRAVIKKCRWYIMKTPTLHQTRCTDTPEPTRVGAVIDEGSPETYICCYITGFLPA